MPVDYLRSFSHPQHDYMLLQGWTVSLLTLMVVYMFTACKHKNPKSYHIPFHQMDGHRVCNNSHHLATVVFMPTLLQTLRLLPRINAVQQHKATGLWL